MFFRKKKITGGPVTRDEVDLLDSEIAKYEALIKNAPVKLREQRERERNTIPAPDDLADRRRERRFYADLSKGQVQNQHRYRTRNTVLFVLLVTATFSICWWIYSELLRNGVLN